MSFSDSVLRDIEAKLPLNELIGEYTPLTFRGERWWGCCPFHAETTPSFSVTPERRIFYCFGCHEGGGYFTFTMKAEKMKFREAVLFLAKKAGVSVVEET